MRAILTLAFLIVSLRGAVPEVKYQDQLGGSDEQLTTGSLNSRTAAEANRGQLVLALLHAPADAPHRQDEDATRPPQTTAPTAGHVDTDQLPPDSVETLCKAMLASAQRNDLPVTFFANLIWQESRFQHDAVSSAGALGIAQFMPEVAMDVGLGNPFDPHEALPASARLLRALHEQFGNLGFAAAAYNAGPHRVADWLEHGRTLPYETQAYVTRVTGRSIETWRKSPQVDSQVTFVRPLPCRGLPTFADIERTQLRLAREMEAEQQSHKNEAATAPVNTASAPAPRHPARMYRLALAARHTGVERHLAIIRHPAATDHLVRNFRVERLEVVHRAHPAREKRRMV